MGRVRLSRGAEEKRPVSFISAPSFCGVRVAEPSLVLLANPNVAASALLRRVVACFAYSELKTDRTDTVAELSRVWTLAWAGRARGDYRSVESLESGVLLLAACKLQKALRPES